MTDLENIAEDMSHVLKRFLGGPEDYDEAYELAARVLRRFADWKRDMGYGY